MEASKISLLALVLVCGLGHAVGQYWCQLLGGTCVNQGSCLGTLIPSSLMCTTGLDCCQPVVPTAPPPSTASTTTTTTTTTTTAAPTVPTTTAPSTLPTTTLPPFGDWSFWSPCSVTCGTGLKQRVRACNHAQCPDPWDEQTGTCEAGPCPAWGVWSPWTPCTVSCGGGEKQRRRACVIEGSSTPATGCQGLDSESQPCSTDVCPDPSCGTSNGFMARMFNSKLSTQCDAPWVVHFQLVPTPDPTIASTACTGVLVDANSVLTTAMCAKMIEDFVAQIGPNFVRLTVGDFDTAQSTDGDVIGISSFTYPSNYSLQNVRPFSSPDADPVFTEWDLAVVQLQGSVTVGICKNYACLPDSYRSLNFSDCRVNSFGTRGMDGTVAIPTNVLQEADPQIRPDAFCEAALSFTSPDYPGPEKFKEHFFCGTKPASYNFCKGDEAAVMTCRDVTTGQWTAVGLGRLHPTVAAASLDPTECATPHGVVIYSKVQPALSWVRQTMAEN